MKYFLKALPIIGFVLFGGVVFFAIFFAEGYQFDYKTQDIVKKGVVYFEEGITENVVIYVDGVVFDASVTAPNELRLPIGPHYIEIKKAGYLPWVKNVIVPEENVLKFREIRLLPATQSFIKKIEAVSRWIFQSSSETGFLIFNPSLKFAKYYNLYSDGKFWVRDIPLTMEFKSLIALSEKLFLGFGKNLFYYDADDGKAVSVKEISVVNVKQAGGKAFVLDKSGKIFYWDSVKNQPKLFFNITGNKFDFKRVSRAGDYFLFFTAVDNKDTLIVTQEDGARIFQNSGVASAYAEDDTLYYVSDNEMVLFDLKEGKKLLEYAIKGMSIKWFSRIADSFHFLVLTQNNNLLYCDEDLENCNQIAVLDSQWIESSKNREYFSAIISGQFVLLDFGKKLFLPQILNDLISRI